MRLNAAGYNGYRSDLLMPEVLINFTDGEEAFSDEKDSGIFAAIDNEPQ